MMVESDTDFKFLKWLYLFSKLSYFLLDRIVDFMNDLISLGVAGFRVDAVKHMWPGDLDGIFNSLVNLPTSKGFPAGSRPFIFQEVIDQGGKSV